MLRLPDDWIWDSWIADDGDTYHLFFLQAPRALVDPARRHTAATIGRATSADLRTWDYRGIALGAADSGWDDLALWTGSVVRGDDGVWRMFYTGLSTAGRASSTSASAWRSRTTSPPGGASARRPSSRSTRAGTGRSTTAAGRARPGATRSSSATPAATAGTYW